MSRSATGPHTRSESIRAWIRLDPSTIEPGLRLVDFDLKTGPHTSLDAIGLDRFGGLVLIAVAAGDPEAALARLLDGQLWFADQRDLLGRHYSDRGAQADRPARGFLLAASFTHAFLRRLSLLTVEIVPFLARDVDSGDGTLRTIVEPAASLFGLPTQPARPVPATDAEDRKPFWPDGVLPSEDTVSRGSLPVVAEVERAQPPMARAAQGGDDDMPWPNSPDEMFRWEVEAGRPESAAADADEAGTAADAHPPPSVDPLPAEPAPAFENLTIDELEEFERFERQRRERGRRTS